MPTEEVEVLVSGVQGIDGRNPLYPSCRRVDLSTTWEAWFGLNCHGRLVGTWKANVGRIFKHRAFKKCRKMKFSELGVPGVEKLNGPYGILFHLSRACQLPYSEKSEKCRKPNLIKRFPIYSLFQPLWMSPILTPVRFGLYERGLSVAWLERGVSPALGWLVPGLGSFCATC